MKVVLRRRLTSEYLDCKDTWTTDLEEAYDFKRPDEAMLFAQRFQIQDVEIVLWNERPVAEMVLSVPPTIATGEDKPASRVAGKGGPKMTRRKG